MGSNSFLGGCSVDGVKAQSLALVAASEDGSIVGSPDYRRSQKVI